MPLSKDEILAACVSPTREVEIDGLGAVLIRRLNSAEQFEIEDIAKQHENNSIFPVMRRFVQFGLANEDGSRMFAEGDEAETLERLPVEVLPVLALEIQSFSGMGVAAQEEAGKESGSPDGGSSP